MQDSPGKLAKKLASRSLGRLFISVILAEARERIITRRPFVAKFQVLASLKVARRNQFIAEAT